MIKRGFTLIELLVVISIIGILLGLSIFGLQGARTSSRDARRKADLEMIRSGLEIYKADCDKYYISNSLPTVLQGDNSNSTCLSTNTYIAQVPADPLSGTRNYAYTSDGSTYTLCAALEQGGSGDLTCGSCGTIGCNWVVRNP